MAPLAAVLGIAATLMMASYGTPQHAVLIDLPHPGMDPDNRIQLPIDLLRLDGEGYVYWNGEPVTPARLTKILLDRQTDDRIAGLRFAPDADAAYGDAALLLQLVKASGNAEAGFCFHDHHRYRKFGKPGVPTASLSEERSWPCDPAMDGRFAPPLPFMPTIR